jgi:hypothetical protein
LIILTYRLKAGKKTRTQNENSKRVSEELRHV